ncbi:hypothetical protein D3C85_1647170 [compost metagenome]
MASSAQFKAVSANLNDPHHIAILFSEQSHGSHCFSFINRLKFNNDIQAVPDLLVDTLLDSGQLFWSNAAQVREVKPQTTRLNQGTGLIHMISQSFFQCFMKQMGSGMILDNI